MEITRRALRRAGAAAATATAVATGLALGASPAQAAPPPTTTAFAVAWNHVTAPKTDTGGFFGGWAVSMICWRDGAWYNGTNRWFWVSGYGLKVDGSGGTVTGFVSASLIKNQQTVGHCSFG
jgi:hypothetical protein